MGPLLAMRRAVRGSGLVAVLAVSLFAVTSCADAPSAALARKATLSVHALTPATIRELVVEISGAGIDPTQLVNLPVDESGVAAGTIETTAGSGRMIVVTAVDTAGVSTHRGDTTVTLVPGPNPPLALVLRPIGATVGLTVTFGTLHTARPQ